MSTRRVVVTGLGATTPLGGTSPRRGTASSPAGPAPRPSTTTGSSKYELPVHLRRTIAPQPVEVLTRVEIRRLDPSAQYALIAAREAWADAGTPEVDRERLGVAIASGIGGVWTLLDQWDILREKGPRRVFPLTVPMLMPNGPAAQRLARPRRPRRRPHPRRPPAPPAPRPWATRLDMIRSGRADVVVAGGTEAAIHPLPIAGFAAMQALSTRNDDPEHASRPYDTDRDGFVIGEGAGVIVLESEEHAAARGARIYAELAGVGMSADAYHITAPEPEGAGASRAMREAVERAGLADSDIVHVNAHATSTPVGDIAEANAIQRALGDDADDMSRHRHEVDDRPPARRRRRARGDASRSSRCTTGSPRDDQRRRPRPRDPARRRPRRAPHRCPTATSRRSTTRSASAATTSPWSSAASEPPHGIRARPRDTTRARGHDLTGPSSSLRGAGSRRSADLVQPAHRGAVAGVPERLELVVPAGPSSRSISSWSGLGSPGRARASRRRSSCTTASPVADVMVWWMPRRGVWDQRDPSHPGDGSSVTS